jgi:putative ABC transport system permease protein
VAFAFAVTPKLLGLALFYSVAMGLLGGLFPAWRAARLPVVTALREL